MSSPLVVCKGQVDVSFSSTSACYMSMKAGALCTGHVTAEMRAAMRMDTWSLARESVPAVARSSCGPSSICPFPCAWRWCLGAHCLSGGWGRGDRGRVHVMGCTSASSMDSVTG